MANITKANLKDISKQELAEAYAKLKLKDTKRRAEEKQTAQELISDLVTVGSGTGMGYLMGTLVARAEEPTAQEAADGITYLDKVREQTQILGFDIDLVVSGVAAGLALSGYGGNFSNTLRAIGVGGLTGWAARNMFFRAIENNEDEDKRNKQPAGPLGGTGRYPSQLYGVD